MCLDASARVFEGLHGRQLLREKSGLDLLCNFQFLCNAAFKFQLLRSQPSLSFNCPVNLIVAHKRKRVSIHILKASEYSAQTDGSGAPAASSVERRVTKWRSYLTRLKRGVLRNRTPRLRHSSNLAITSSATKTIPVARPISLYCLECGGGAIGRGPRSHPEAQQLPTAHRLEAAHQK